MPAGKSLIFLGLLLLVIGVILTYGPKLPFPLGRLPGDIHIQKGNFSFAFPIVTCLTLSLLLTLLLNLLFRR